MRCCDAHPGFCEFRRPDVEIERIIHIVDFLHYYDVVRKKCDEVLPEALFLLTPVAAPDSHPAQGAWLWSGSREKHKA